MELYPNGLKDGKYCPNCDTEQFPDTDFCHRCGQKHTDIKRPLWSFFMEFLDAILNIDTKFLRAIIPFLFKPGYLTRVYVEGKRTTYFPPLRIYLLVMLIFSVGMGVVLNQIKEQKLDDRKTKNTLFIKMNFVYQELKNNENLYKPASYIITAGKKFNITGTDFATLTPEEIITKYDYTGFWEKVIVTQIVKAHQNLTQFIFDLLVSKLLWLNFLMVFVVAFILKLFLYS